MKDIIKIKTKFYLFVVTVMLSVVFVLVHGTNTVAISADQKSDASWTYKDSERYKKLPKKDRERIDKSNASIEAVRDHLRSNYKVAVGSSIKVELDKKGNLKSVSARGDFTPPDLNIKPKTDEDYMKIGNAFINKEKKLIGLVDKDMKVVINPKIGQVVGAKFFD